MFSKTPPKTNLLFLVVAFILGFILGNLGYSLEIGRAPFGFDFVRRVPPGKEVDFSTFWRVWDLLEEKYIGEVSPGALLEGAIKGMVGSLGDPYTYFLTSQENEEFKLSLGGEYEGIGAELSIRDGKLIIVSPLDNSPALGAGLKAGDHIQKIEGEETLGISLEEAVRKIRGASGTKVNLTIQRGDSDPFEVPITREQIKIVSVRWETLEEKLGIPSEEAEGIAYIRVAFFGEETNGEWDRVVGEVKSAVPDLSAIILDLRSNPGGFLNASVHLASEFISSGVVVKEEFGDGGVEELKVDRQNGAFVGKKIIVLIDGGSASASEILAGALKERANAVLIGEKSFGKGTVQDAQDLEGGAGIHITISKWLTPNGVWVDKVGITPDILVALTDEDWDKGLDPQLDRAIEEARE